MAASLPSFSGRRVGGQRFGAGETASRRAEAGGNSGLQSYHARDLDEIEDTER